MKKANNLGNKFGEIFNTVKNAREKISQALQENVVDIDTLNSIHRETLNFALLEEDIENIHTRIEQEGYSVLGSRLILDDKKELIEIKTYSKKGEKSFLNTISATVKGVTNILTEILDEMKTKGRAEISFKFDDWFDFYLI